MTAPDPYEMLLAEIGRLLRDEGDPAGRYALARSLAEQMGVKAAHAARDLVAQTGSLAAAADRLEVSPQAISQLLAKHGIPSPNKPGRPRKDTTDAARD